MVIYIDETEHDDYFIVAGILVDSEQDVLSAYKKFKHSIKNYPMSRKAKENVFLEFKSTLIDYRFQRIKIKLLEHISNIDGTVIYSCYVKKQKNMKQFLKQSVYITLLSNIINSIEGEVEVVFDEFKNKQFEEAIILTFSEFPNVKSIMKDDSQGNPGLQLADNICSVIRLHLTNTDTNDYYKIIEPIVRNA